MLNLGAAAFRMNYDDIQVTQQVQVLGGGGAVVGIVTNGGKAKSEGIELEATLRPTSALRLSAGVGYVDARYTDYVDTSRGTPVSFNGNQLNNAPRLTANLSVAYSLPLPVGSLTLRLDGRHADGSFVGRENLATLALYSNNLFDKRYIVAKVPGGFAAPVGAGTNQTISYGRPRSYGIVGTFTF